MSRAPPRRPRQMALRDAPATQATRNKLYAALAAGARQAETFTTIVRPVSVAPVTSHTGESTHSPSDPTTCTYRGNPTGPDLFSPDSEWQRVDPPANHHSLPPPKEKEREARASEITNTTHRPTEQPTRPKPQHFPSSIANNKQLVFTHHLTSPVVQAPIRNLLTSTPSSPSPLTPPQQIEVPECNSILTNTSTSTRITDWAKSVHQALRQHEATSSIKSSEHSTLSKKTHTAKMDGNTIAKALAVIRDAISGGAGYESANKKLASAPIYPVRQELDGRVFSPHPTTPFPVAQESILLSPFGAGSARQPPSHPLHGQSLNDQGYEAYSRHSQANMYEEAARKAALEHEYTLKNEELRRKAEKVDAAMAVAQQQQYETVDALEKEKRALLLLLRQRDNPAPASTPVPSAPALAPQMPSAPPVVTISALNQENAQLKLGRQDDHRRIAELEEVKKTLETLVESAKKSQSHSAKQASEAIIKGKELENKLAECEKRCHDLEKRCHDAEKRAKEAENARKDPSLVNQLNLKITQLKNAQTERDSWEKKSRQSNNEYSKLADKLKQVRMENAGLFARLEENSGKKNIKEENLVRDKKGLKEALIAERAVSDRLRRERTLLQEKLQKVRQQLALAQAQLQARDGGGPMGPKITSLPSVSQVSLSLSKESDPKFKHHARAEEDADEVIEDGKGSNVLPIRKGNEGWSEADLGGSGEGDSVSMPDIQKTETQAFKNTFTSPPLRALSPYSPKPLTPSMSRLIFPEKRTIKRNLLRDSPSPRLSAPSVRTGTDAKIEHGAHNKIEADMFEIMTSKTKTISAPKAEVRSAIDPFADLGAALGLGMTLPPTPKKETSVPGPRITTSAPLLL